MLARIQCPSNDLKREQIKSIPYASVIEILMYTETARDQTSVLPVEMLEGINIIINWFIRKLQRKFSNI